MNDAERDLIAGLFQRIRSVETARRDPEAEAFIAAEVSRQSHAPYAMAQTLVVQDRSIEAAQARIAELERELEEARAGSERPASFSQPSGSSQSAPSPWGPRAQETMARAEAARSGGGSWTRSDQPSSPSFGAPQTGYGQQGGYGQGQQPPGYGAPQPRYEEPSRGGGFLSGALQTAAGVAAGALIFQGARSIFGGDDEKAQSAAGDAARAEGGTQAADAGDSGGEGATKDIGDWYSGLFGGSDGASGGDDSGGDDGGDWT